MKQQQIYYSYTSYFAIEESGKHNILDKMIHTTYMFLNILFSIHVTIYIVCFLFIYYSGFRITYIRSFQMKKQEWTISHKMSEPFHP